MLCMPEEEVRGGITMGWTKRGCEGGEDGWDRAEEEGEGERAEEVGIARVGFKQVISQIGPSDEGFLSVESDSDSPIRSRMDGSNWSLDGWATFRGGQVDRIKTHPSACRKGESQTGRERRK
jgi:hypothetical protein